MRQVMLVAALAAVVFVGPGSASGSGALEGLASKSDKVAERLDAGDTCDALAKARDLQHSSQKAIAAGDVPAAVAPPLTEATNRLVDEIPCEPGKKPKKGPPGHEKPGKHGGPGED